MKQIDQEPLSLSFSFPSFHFFSEFWGILFEIGENFITFAVSTLNRSFHVSYPFLCIFCACKQNISVWFVQNMTFSFHMQKKINYEKKMKWIFFFTKRTVSIYLRNAQIASSIWIFEPIFLSIVIIVARFFTKNCAKLIHQIFFPLFYRNCRPSLI